MGAARPRGKPPGRGSSHMCGGRGRGGRGRPPVRFCPDRKRKRKRNHDPLEPFTSLFLVLVRTNLTFLGLPIPLVVSRHRLQNNQRSPWHQPSTTKAVQTTLDEDDKLSSQSSQHYWSQTVHAVICTSADHNLTQFPPQQSSSPGTPLIKQ